MNVLFDLDGTLTDPREGILACIRYAMSELDRLAPPDAVLMRYIGPPLQDTFRTLLTPADASLVAHAVDLYRKRFTALGIYENRVYPGIMPMLQTLYERGDTLFVATSKPREFAVRVVEHFALAGYFLDVFGSDMDGTRSDKSELLRHLMSVEKLEPAATVMVGDREQDVFGARAAGIRSIGVLWGYGSRKELETAGAHVLCDSPTALPETLTTSLDPRER